MEVNFIINFIAQDQDQSDWATARSWNLALKPVYCGFCTGLAHLEQSICQSARPARRLEQFFFWTIGRDVSRLQF